MRPIKSIIEFKQIIGRGTRLYDGKDYFTIYDRDETELRAIWSAPDTRKNLLQGLADKGFGGEQLSEMQKSIFVLSHYVSVGVQELEQEKLTPLLRLKYHNSISDAVPDLGRPEDIGMIFAGFQKYLYQQSAVA